MYYNYFGTEYFCFCVGDEHIRKIGLKHNTAISLMQFLWTHNHTLHH